MSAFISKVDADVGVKIMSARHFRLSVHPSTARDRLRNHK